MQEGIAIGTPAEKAAAFPLAWATEPFHAALTGSFVKVLIRFQRTMTSSFAKRSGKS